MTNETVPADVLPAAFESASLVQCTDVGRLPGRRRQPEWRTAAGAGPLFPAALAEFDHEDAAGRLTALLGELGYAASREVRTGGGRRRYNVQRVLVPPAQRTEATRTLAAAWRQGRRSLLNTDPLGASSPRNAQRATLARAAWRAALLAGGRRSRTDFLGVRLGDQEMAAILVRAARMLGVTAVVLPRPGCLLVTVSAPEERTRILGTMSAAGFARRRAPALV
jgi:hypothetical protein